MQDSSYQELYETILKIQVLLSQTLNPRGCDSGDDLDDLGDFDCLSGPLVPGLQLLPRLPVSEELVSIVSFDVESMTHQSNNKIVHLTQRLLHQVLILVV